MYSLAALHEFPDSGACFPVAGRRCSTTCVIPACLLQAGESRNPVVYITHSRLCLSQAGISGNDSQMRHSLLHDLNNQPESIISS